MLKSGPLWLSEHIFFCLWVGIMMGGREEGRVRSVFAGGLGSTHLQFG